MMEKQLFNLEKIKHLTSPIDEFQEEVNNLKNISKKIETSKDIAIRNIAEKNFLDQIEEIFTLLNKINDKLTKVTEVNMNRFIEFQDNLIRKYKENFRDDLKKLELNENTTQKIGFYLIENQKILKIIDQVSYVPSINLNVWLELLESLRQNTLFLNTINKMRTYYNRLIQKKFENEKKKIPKGVDESIIKDYRKAFQENPQLTFKEFLHILENKLTQKELGDKKDILERAREKEKYEILKKKQEEQQELYKDYLKLSDREFKRRRRKQSREKLADVKELSKNSKEVKLSKEVSDKIEKFKSQLDKSFKEKYLIQKDDDSDPIEIIRERKKRKDKEFKKYKQHFEKEEP